MIITLVGWIALMGGLWRMAAPRAPQAPDTILTFAGLAAGAAIGAVLTVIAYGPKAYSTPKPTDA